jgi:predicted small lipoprotein YifL
MLHSKGLNQTVILIVKPSFALNIAAAAVLASLLAGCGQPGPLYMPKPPTKPAPPAAPATPTATSPNTQY